MRRFLNSFLIDVTNSVDLFLRSLFNLRFFEIPLNSYFDFKANGISVNTFTISFYFFNLDFQNFRKLLFPFFVK